MSFAVARFLRRPLARSFTTTSTCQNSLPESSAPIPRKGRTSKVDPTTESLLPPQKLRALVSLYHQSEDFITEDNLMNHIDAAFLGCDTQQQNFNVKLEHKKFAEVLRNQRAAPRFAPWYHENTTPDRTKQFSGQRSDREKQIVDALYGVESGSLPGYETLVEAAKAKKTEPKQEYE